MRTVEEQSSTSGTLLGRLKRDGRVLRKIARMLFGYFTAGRRLRRLYHAKEHSGEIYWLD